MNVTPYLDKTETDKHGRHKINIDVTWQGQRFREFSGERVKAKDWNDNKKLVKASESMHTQINDSLSDTINRIKTVWYELHKVSATVDKDAFKDAVKRARFPEKFTEKKRGMTLIEFIGKFQKDFAGQLAPGYLESFSQLAKNLQHINPDLTPSDMGLERINEYISYGTFEVGLSDNSLAIHISRFRKLLSYAEICGYSVPKSYLLASVKTHDSDRVFLTPEELERLHNHQFDNRRLSLSAGRFLLACYTGFRYSDLVRLSDNMTEWETYQTFEIRQKKTRDSVRVAMNEYAEEIWKRYDGKLMEGFKDDPNQYYNIDVKEVCRQVDITTPVTISEMRQSKLVEYVLPKCEAVSSHSARHTFAVNSIIRGMDLYTLSKIMGHRSVTSTERYAQIVDSMKHEKMLHHWKR